jgi:homocysteine S-methyltransferase
MATPEYFDVFLRRTVSLARRSGSCCGTTPEHIRWMAKSRMLGDHHIEIRPERGHRVRGGGGPHPAPLAERAFAAGAAGKFVVSVEVNPAPGLDPSKALEGAKMLIDSGVDIVNVADGPRAMARMSNLAFCALLIERCGIQPILHVCGRDRNLLGQFSHLLGAHAIGIRNLVMITGDPPKVGDYQEATAVYDVDAIGLLQMASNANRGLDPAGKPSPGGKTSFLIATGFEPGAADLDRRCAA